MYSFLVYSLAPYSYIDSEVAPYLNDFRIKMWDNCGDGKMNPTWQVSIKIVDKIPFSDKEVIGQCQRKPLGFDVMLLKDFWNASDDNNRRQLVYHELLHCYLFVHHTPNSLMSEYHTLYNPK